MSMYMLAQKNKDVSCETQCLTDIGIVTGGTLLRQIRFITLYVNMVDRWRALVSTVMNFRVP
jgi:hypothetical protein